MKSSVIIKGNKYGFQIVLNPTIPFEELLRNVEDKFKESAGFFDKSRPMAISFVGRSLTSGQQNLLVDTISESGGLQIPYIIDGAAAYETEFAQAIREADPDLLRRVEDSSAGREKRSGTGIREERKRESQSSLSDVPDTEKAIPVQLDKTDSRVGMHGQFYRGTLRSGQKIEVEGSIVVLGDINPGAQIVAGGNVVVLGCLKGIIYAGYPNDRNALVAALLMDPMQIQIGDCIARSEDAKGRPKKLRRKKEPELEPKLAFVEKGNIFVETITRSLISEISTNQQDKGE